VKSVFCANLGQRDNLERLLIIRLENFFFTFQTYEVETYEIIIASYLTGVKRALLRGQKTM
jgi:hypothetical protein